MEELILQLRALVSPHLPDRAGPYQLAVCVVVWQFTSLCLTRRNRTSNSHPSITLVSNSSVALLRPGQAWGGGRGRTARRGNRYNRVDFCLWPSQPMSVSAMSDPREWNRLPDKVP